MNFEKTNLKDGSTLIVVNVPKSLSITFKIFIRSGPRFDPKNRPGLSHFVEHLMFKGTKKYNNSEILSRTLESCGAMAEGFSYQETNIYTIKIPKNNLDIAIDILMEQVHNSLFRTKDIEKEKGVILEEFEMTKSNPSSYIWELWSENIWKNNALGRIYCGNPTDINSFNKKNITNFIKNNYLPQNTVYVISGDISSKKVKKIINNYLSPAPVNNIQKSIETKIIRNNPIKIENNNDSTITVNYGFLTDGAKNKDRHILELLEYLLGRGLGCRLNQKTTEKGLTYFTMAHTQFLSDTGYFLIDFTAQTKNINHILEIINRELTSIKNGHLSSKEITRAKEYYIGQLLINNETTDALANWYGHQAIIDLHKILSIAEKQKIMKNIKKTELVKVANKYFTKDNWYLSAIGPIKEKDIKIDL